MKTEEFTFPRVDPNNAQEHLTVIPSLWRISSLVHSNRTDFDLQNGTRGNIFTKSFSKVQGEMNKEARNPAAAAAAEEKMDMLWEDFNEEIIRQSISCVESSGSDSESENKAEAIDEYSSCHLKSVYPKKKKLVLVFKKLFLLQNRTLIKNRELGRV